MRLVCGKKEQNNIRTRVHKYKRGEKEEGRKRKEGRKEEGK